MLFILASLLLAVLLGYGLAQYLLEAEYRRLAALRTMVRRELATLQQLQRITDAYVSARQELRRSRSS